MRLGLDKDIRFSIVIPSLNQGSYIEAAITSVLEQFYKNKEIIVIDGGSTDNTLGILDSFSHEISWISEPDRGQSHAINKGFRRASGSIYSWLNSDDLLYPGALEKVAEKFNCMPEVDLIFGNCNYIDQKDRIIKRYPTEDFNFIKYVENAFNYIPQPATFFRSSLFSEIGELNESLHFAMDFEYWLRAGSSKTITHIPDIIAALRVHPQAKSTKDRERFSDEMVGIYERIMSDPETSGLVEKNLAMKNLYYRVAHTAYWSNANRKAFHFALKAFKLDRCKPSRLLVQCLFGVVGLHLKYFLSNPYTE